jgi:hypothetical protein
MSCHIRVSHKYHLSHISVSHLSLISHIGWSHIEVVCHIQKSYKRVRPSIQPPRPAGSTLPSMNNQERRTETQPHTTQRTDTTHQPRTKLSISTFGGGWYLFLAIQTNYKESPSYISIIYIHRSIYDRRRKI